LTLEGHPSEAAAAWDRLQVEEEDRQKVETDHDGETGARNPQRSENSIAAAGDQEKASRLRQNQSQSKIFDIFSVDVRARTALAVFIMGMQQLSGIDGVLYVSVPRRLATSFNLQHSVGFDSTS
jgi:DNA-directed RNA polymerase III subunit RPC2